jgi:hypothetical protein
MLFASSRAQIVTIDFLGFLYRRSLQAFKLRDRFVLGAGFRVGWGEGGGGGREWRVVVIGASQGA